MVYKLKIVDKEGNQIELKDASIDNYQKEPVYETREEAEKAKEDFRISLPRSFRITIEEKEGEMK